MKSSSNVLRRTGLAGLALGLAAAALGFTFTLNDEGDGKTGMPIKWPAGPIAVRIMLGDSPGLFDGSNFNSSARTAAQIWNGVMGSAQIQTTVATGTPTENNDLNEMAFASTIYGQAFGENVLAVTLGSRNGNERVEADILFNSGETWNSYRGPRPGSLPADAMDLQRVAIHELGHLLGLDHPNEADQEVTAIMNSRISNSVDTITDDDTAGVRSLYGPPGVPSNDNFASAADISLAGNQSVTVRGHNTNATKEANDKRQGNNPGGRSVWWRWTAPSNGDVILDTGKENPTTHVTDVTGEKSSYFDTTLGVYTGASLAALTQLVDNDDINPGVVQVSRVTFSATGGTTYHICVDGYNAFEDFPTDTNGADNGGITLNLAFTGTLGAVPAITTQPASVTVTAGTNASFSVVATGPALAYQWNFNGSPITGATGSSYSISSASSTNAGTYQVVISNQAGSVTSNNVSLTVNPAPAPSPPPSSGGGGGGGGGAPSLWFFAVLAALGLVRLCRHSRS